MSKPFLRALLERAIKTFAQTLVALLGATAVDVMSVGWVQLLSVAAGAALVSVLTSIASSGFGSTNGPSLAGEELPVPRTVGAHERLFADPPLPRREPLPDLPPVTVRRSPTLPYPRPAPGTTERLAERPEGDPI